MLTNPMPDGREVVRTRAVRPSAGALAFVRSFAPQSAPITGAREGMTS